MIYQSVSELVGKTPLLALHAFSKKKGLHTPVIAKLEYFNPGGSVKDRVAREMLDTAEREGKLLPGGVIIEPTSGNTGIGIAAIGISRGYQVIITMPETMSVERRNLLTAYGAQLVLTEGAKGMTGAIEKAKQMQQEIPGAFMPGQFENAANVAAHLRTTGPEIWEDSEGKIDIFVAGIGTGGTITGVGTFLKSKNPNIKIIGVEPADSPVLSGGAPGPHKIQGIGAGFIPSILNTKIYDALVQVKNEDAFQTGSEAASLEGLLVGISSGAALWAAATLAKQPENAQKTIVALLPDTGERYLSTPMFLR